MVAIIGELVTRLAEALSITLCAGSCCATERLQAVRAPCQENSFLRLLFKATIKYATNLEKKKGRFSHVLMIFLEMVYSVFCTHERSCHVYCYPFRPIFPATTTDVILDTMTR